MHLKRHRLVTAGLRGLLCAGLATLFTAGFSWTFVEPVTRSRDAHEFWTKRQPLATMRPAQGRDTLHGYQQPPQSARGTTPG
jgi:hypothetical protein